MNERHRKQANDRGQHVRSTLNPKTLPDPHWNKHLLKEDATLRQTVHWNLGRITLPFVLKNSFHLHGPRAASVGPRSPRFLVTDFPPIAGITPHGTASVSESDVTCTRG